MLINSYRIYVSFFNCTLVFPRFKPIQHSHFSPTFRLFCTAFHFHSISDLKKQQNCFYSKFCTPLLFHASFQEKTENEIVYFNDLFYSASFRRIRINSLGTMFIGWRRVPCSARANLPLLSVTNFKIIRLKHRVAFELVNLLFQTQILFQIFLHFHSEIVENITNKN